MKREYVKIGRIDEHDGRKDYVGGYKGGGRCFKDEEIFEKQHDEICYIAESEFNDVAKNGKIVDLERLQEELSCKLGYTYNDILSLTDGNEFLTRFVFDGLAYQHPETYINEILDTFSDEEIQWMKLIGKLNLIYAYRINKNKAFICGLREGKLFNWDVTMDTELHLSRTPKEGNGKWPTENELKRLSAKVETMNARYVYMVTDGPDFTDDALIDLLING